MYETSGKLNEETGKEFLKIAMTSGQKRLLKIMSLVCFLMAIIFVVFWILSSMKIFLVYAAICVALIIYLFIVFLIVLGKIKLSYIDSIKEFSDKGELEFKSFFNENGVNISNLTTSANFEIKHEFFYRLEETPSMYVLITKSGQYVLIFKNYLNSEEIKSFKAFIKTKCKKIK